jgi:hypothetical protein
MFGFLFPLMLATFLSVNEPNLADTEVVRVGGIRKASVEIELSGDQYRVAASFIPVRCFDSSMNVDMNRRKAELIAASGLHSYLKVPKDQRLVFKAIELPSSREVKGKLVVSFKIPRSSILKEKRAMAVDTPITNSDRPFFNAIADYEQTLQFLADGIDWNRFATDLDDSDFAEQVSEFEFLYFDRFDALAKEASSEITLLSDEQTAILTAVKKSRNAFIEKLKSIVRDQQSKSERPTSGK